MKIGEKIKAARKKRGWTLEQLGTATGLGISTLSGYENANTKGGPGPDTLCKIADALNDLSILVHHCQACPVRKHVFLKQFPDLNNIRRDHAILARLEAIEQQNRQIIAMLAKAADQSDEISPRLPCAARPAGSRGKYTDEQWQAMIKNPDLLREHSRRDTSRRRKKYLADRKNEARA